MKMLQKLCCMRLPTAGMVIGWLGIVGSMVCVVVTSIILAYAHEVAQFLANKMTNVDNVDVDAIRTVIIIAGSVFLTVTLLNLISSGMLVVGIIKERHLFLLPWLINSGVVLGFNVLHYVYLCIMTLSQYREVGNVTSIFCSSTLVLSLQFYIYYGIYSLFKHIQKTREEKHAMVQSGANNSHSGATYPGYTKV